jgi:hypothetical protein
MQYPSSTHQTFVQGFPSALEELRALPEIAEPDLILGLQSLLVAAGMNITLCEAEVLSGSAAQFIYDREHPECAELSFVPPTETLFRSLDITWKEVTPSGTSTAFDVVRQWIELGRLTLARFKEPILIYGFAQNGVSSSLLAARPKARLAEETISASDCEKKYWRFPLDEGNLLMCIEHAPRQIENLTTLAAAAAHRAVRLWHVSTLASCATGDHAYRRLAADMADSDVDFTDQSVSAWMGQALWRQWTARSSSQRFFKRIAPRFGGADRAAYDKAAFCYEQCVEGWKQWAACLGPTWNLRRQGFTQPYPDDFIARWRDPELRMKGSRRIEQARAWEEKAIAELTKTIR